MPALTAAPSPESERRDHAVAERGAVADGVAGRHAHLGGDDLDAHLVVGARPGDHARLYEEALAQQLHAAPGRDRIVRRQDDCAERGADVGHSRIASTP